MTQILTEQMRSLAKRLHELDSSPGAAMIPGSKETVPIEPTQGSVMPKQLADILGMQDINLFTRAWNKLRQGREHQLTRQEMAELSIAFMKLVLADPNDTTKAMSLLRRISAKNPE